MIMIITTKPISLEDEIIIIPILFYTFINLNGIMTTRKTLLELIDGSLLKLTTESPISSTIASTSSPLLNDEGGDGYFSTTKIIVTTLTASVGTNGQNKRPAIVIYPTVSPESIVIPIVSCILGFPLLALLIICCLRKRAKLARERDRRRNYDLQDHAVSLVRFSPIHRLTNRTTRAVSLRSERSLSRGFPSLELDTVIEERSDPDQTQTDLMTTPDSPPLSNIIPNINNRSNKDYNQIENSSTPEPSSTS